MKKYLFFLFLFFSLLGFSQNKTDSYISKYSSIAVVEMNKYSIPASITLAQGILESGNGESRLAVDGKNHFGIKCHSNWNGKTIIVDDDEKGECFRKYSKVTDSYRDHSLFLSERGRYSFLFTYKKSDYKKWARGLKKAGYATNPNYASLLIDLIEKYELYNYDKIDQPNKQLYFVHNYGLPYLTGIGAFYFKKRSVIFSEVNTSFVFSGASIGYHYELLNKFYVGASSGLIYFPTKEREFIPQISTELMFRKFSKNKLYNSVLIRGGVQLPLEKIDFKLIPYVSLSYLFK